MVLFIQDHIVIKNKIIVKVIFFSVFIFLFNACRIIELQKLISKQEINFVHNYQNIDIVNNRLITLDNNLMFCLDLGGPNCIFKSKIEKFNIIDSLNVGVLIKANAKKIPNKIVVIDDIKTDFFSINNAIFRVIPDILFCQNIMGIIGPELFMKKSLILNFKENKLEISEITPNLNGYTELKVINFDGYYYNIEILLNNQPISVKFDTGNSHELLLTMNETDHLSTKKDYFYYINSENKIDSNSISQDLFSFSKSKVDHNISTILYKNGKRNLLGMGIIKKYNWILDYKNGKIYCQNISKNNEDFNKNKFTIKDNKLVLIQSDKLNSKYLNKIVIEANNTIINENNVCDFYLLLNSKNSPNKITFQK